MATNQRRRSSERELLQRQLAERREREVRRRRVALIASIVGTVLVLAAVAVVAVLTTSDSGTPTATCKGGVPGVTASNKTNLKADPGVQAKSSATPQKLECKDLVVGTGKAATPASTVTVQYVGALYKTGKVFDSSWKRGQAATFSLAQVVKGFTQGIGGGQGVPPMKVGGRRIMIIPGALGYGAQGNPQAGIAPDAPLVFVVDLKKIG